MHTGHNEYCDLKWHNWIKDPRIKNLQIVLGSPLSQREPCSQKHVSFLPREMSKSGQSYSGTKAALCGRQVCKPSSPLCLFKLLHLSFFNPEHGYPQKLLHSIAKETSTPNLGNAQFICSNEDVDSSLHSKYQVESSRWDTPQPNYQNWDFFLT